MFSEMFPCILSGVLIYFGYGMWNSTLEITARENEVHASTYQRYDQGVDEGFCGFDDDFYPPSTDAWGAPGGGLEATPPPKAKPESDGLSSKGGGRTIPNNGLAEEDPMDFWRDWLLCYIECTALSAAWGRGKGPCVSARLITGVRVCLHACTSVYLFYVSNPPG